MNKVSLLLVLILASHSTLHADVIVLRSGKQVKCDSVQEEGKTVRCRIGQGSVGIAASTVSKILRSEKPKVPPKSSQPANDLKLAKKYTEKGIRHAQKKEYSQAIESFRKAYQASKDQITTKNLALTYLLSGNNTNAETYFLELLTISPNDTQALNAMAVISLKKGDRYAAEEYWQRSYEIKSDPRVLQNLEFVRSNPELQEPNILKPPMNEQEREETVASYDEDTNIHFQIKYDGGTVNQVLLREILRALEEAYDRLSTEMESEPSESLEVVLYPKRDFLSITGAPDWSGGFNDGRIHLPVGGLLSITDQVKSVILHEETHSFIDFKSGGRRSPSWLQEGLAQYMEGKRIGSSENETLSELLFNRQFPSLKELSIGFFRAKPEKVAPMYAASLSFVEFLINRYRFYKINELLQAFQQGQSIEQAFLNSFEIELSQAEEDWHRSLVMQ